MLRAKVYRGWLTAGLLVVALNQGCGDDSGGGLNNNNNVSVEPFAVVEIVPEGESQDVYLDQTIRITFSRPLDSSTVDASSVRISSDGEDANGRLLPDGQALLFIPAQLKSNASYTVTVSGSVLDVNGTPLGDDYTSTFQTGTVTQGGSEPPDPMVSAPFRHSSFVYLTRQVEYVLVGADYNDSSQNLFAIDPLEFNQTDPLPTEELMYTTSDLAFVPGVHKHGVSGNLDDDPEDEVVLLTHAPTGPAMLRVLDTDGGIFHLDTLDASLMIGGQLGGVYKYDIVLGDVDLDGHDEIVVVGLNEQSEAHLWIYDDQRFAYVLLKEFDVRGVLEGENWSGVNAIEVAVGNIDGDRMNEIVIAMQATGCPALHVAVVEDLTQSYEELNISEVAQTGYCSADTRMRLNLADLDGDSVQELTLSTHLLDNNTASSTCTSHYHMDGLRWSGQDFEVLDTVSDSIVHAGLCPEHYPVDAVAHTLDVDGDRKDEVLLDNHLWKWNSDDESFGRMTYQFDLFATDDTAAVSVAVGDVNGDGLSDILMSRADGSIYAMGIKKTLIGYDLEMNPLYEYEWGVVDERDGGGVSGQFGHLLVPANLDGDSIIVRPSFIDPEDPGGPEGRTVEHRIVFSDDQIIAVLAAAPCYDEDWQNVDMCSTGLGVSVGGTITAGASFSVFAGVSVGVSQDVIAAFGAGKTAFEFTAMLHQELEVSVYGSVSVGVEQTIADYTGYDEDLVVFYTVPYHQFIYTFASHPDPTVQGSALVVNVPMEPRVFSVSREYYNENNGDQPDIDETVLSSVPGDPGSYPSFADVSDVLTTHFPLGFTAPPVTVNQGSGYKELDLEISGEVTVGGSVTLTVEFDTEVCVMGFCVGMNMGISAMAFAEASFSAATIFSSTVGAIDGENWADNIYEYGLFSYLDTRRNAHGDISQLFTVVNYYVD
jgi:Bacterial Ig-like domain